MPLNLVVTYSKALQLYELSFQLGQVVPILFLSIHTSWLHFLRLREACFPNCTHQPEQKQVYHNTYGAFTFLPIETTYLETLKLSQIGSPCLLFLSITTLPPESWAWKGYPETDFPKRLSSNSDNNGLG
jgi:hypothetical protein